VSYLAERQWTLFEYFMHFALQGVSSLILVYSFFFRCFSVIIKPECRFLTCIFVNRNLNIIIFFTYSCYMSVLSRYVSVTQLWRFSLIFFLNSKCSTEQCFTVITLRYGLVISKKPTQIDVRNAVDINAVCQILHGLEMASQKWRKQGTWHPWFVFVVTTRNKVKKKSTDSHVLTVL
jgi:hypothetical protein